MERAIPDACLSHGASWGRGTSVFKRARGRIPRLQHEQVVEKFVDYHFGRLSPEMNIAIERHVRSCERCKREGMQNAASERKGSLRQLRSVRGGKPLLGPRARRWILLLTIVLVLQVVIAQVANGHAGSFLSLLSQSNAGSALTGDQRPPVKLSVANSFPLVTDGATALALSPDNTQLAVAGGAQHNVSIWDVSSEKLVITLSWSDANAPSSLAWSSDGAQLAASDAAQITVWNIATGATTWTISLPPAPSIRVYDIEQQAVVERPDPASAFDGGPLAWGANGALATAPAGALGPAGIVTAQEPLVGVWNTSGSHIFASAGHAQVGADASDLQRGVSLLSWAPGGRYLLWGMLAQSVVDANPATSQSAAPDSLVSALASHIGKAGGANDAYVWFGPLGKRVAICDNTTPGAPLQIVEIATGHVSYQLNQTCAGLTTHDVQWANAANALYVIPTKGPIVVFTVTP